MRCPSTRRPFTRRPVAVAALVLTALPGIASPALAHNVLVGSDPADGAHRDSGPRQVRLTFDQPVRAGYDTVHVIGPNAQHWTAGPARVEGNDVTAPVRELGPAGAYAVVYRVLSDDGHPVTGKTTFTLTSAGRGAPAPNAAEGTQSQEPDRSSGGLPIWPWVLGGIVLVGAGIALALRLGRPTDKG